MENVTVSQAEALWELSASVVMHVTETRQSYVMIAQYVVCIVYRISNTVQPGGSSRQLS